MAEVTVNRACHSPTSSLEQSGLASTTVPIRITRAPVTTVNWGTVSCCRHLCRLFQGERAGWGGTELLGIGTFSGASSRMGSVSHV